MSYTEQKFNIPELKGLSEKQLEVHLGLYAGYVKHVNAIAEHVADLGRDSEKNAYLISELRRRFGFEFDGMRMHEYYFEGFSVGGGSASDGKNGIGEPNAAEKLKGVLEKEYGNFQNWLDDFSKVGMTRGIGWAVLYADPKTHSTHNVWVSDHELGQLAGLPILIAMDMWEHAFMVDYMPSEKKEYINAFFNNLNWSVVEERFKKSK